MTIRKAISQDIDQVEKNYIELLLYEQQHGAYTAWKLGVYPTRETAEKALSEGTLYVMELNKEICASMIINHIQPQEYENIKWKYSAHSDEALVIHLLCVRPSISGRGIGKEMVYFAIKEARRRNCKAIRLDTGSQNKPAIALYTKLGFELAGTAMMDIGDLIKHKDHLFYEIKVKNDIN